MRIRYAVHGLGLRSRFELPEIATEHAPELPQLELREAAVEELDALWSGPGDAPAWHGRLRDGSELTVRRGLAGDVLFQYAQQACFWLDGGCETLLCTELPDAGADASRWRAALVEKVLPKVALMRGYEGLHAAAVDSPVGVVALVGQSGAGKSTIAEELARRGWAPFADDVLLLGARSGGVVAHPDHGRARRPVALVCLLSRASGLVLEAQALAPNPLALAPYMLGFQGDAMRQRARFELYSDLLARAQAAMLTADLADPPGDLAELIEVEVAAIANGRAGSRARPDVRGRDVSARGKTSTRRLSGARR
jgi:hypothetical protein